MCRRVVITGMGAVSPYGEGVPVLLDGIGAGKAAITRLDTKEEDAIAVAGLVPSVCEKRIPRGLRRSMSPLSVYACLAAWEALEQARLPRDGSRRMGVCIGSTLGSPLVLERFFTNYLAGHIPDDVRSTTFFKVMSHSAAANVALACKASGRLLAPAAACASGLGSIALGYEAIALGREEIMLAGGTDEYHVLTSAIFDLLGAASREKDPAIASRPFDSHRSGVVCGEGAGVLVLESLESAIARKALIYAEIAGYAMTSDAVNIAHPNAASMATCMQEALEWAHCPPSAVAYVSAHGTATESGDIAEGQAIASVFGTKTPVASLKGHMGHTMAASGVLESIACVRMLQTKTYLPTWGLETADPRCGEIRLLQSPERIPEARYIVKNSFALGGVHVCLVLKKCDSFALFR